MGSVTNVYDHGGGTGYSEIDHKPVVEHVFSGSVNVPSAFTGMHFHRWPNFSTGVLSPAPTFAFGLVRTHDYGRGVSWKSIEPTKGAFSWADLDEVVNLHYAAGRKVLYTIYGTPTWAATAAGQTRNDPYGYPGGADRPANLTDLSDFITALVTRYSGKIWLEIWNEPYFNQDWTGFFWGSAADMAAMAKTINIAAKAVDASIQVLSPGFTLGQQIVSFLTAADGSGGFGKNHIDGLCCHFYDVQAYKEYPGRSSVADFMYWLKKYLSDSGMSTTFPVYDTEHGWYDAAHPWLSKPESERATELRRIAAVQASHGIKSVAWYSYDGSFIGTPNIANSMAMSKAIQDCHTVLGGKQLRSIGIRLDGSWLITTDSGNTVW